MPKIKKMQLKEIMDRSKDKAQELLSDEGKLAEFLDIAEKRCENIPNYGNFLAYAPLFLSMVRSTVAKEYTAMPVGSVLSVLTALIYWVWPNDLINDDTFIIGQIDDAAVFMICAYFVKGDIDAYIEWRESNEVTDSYTPIFNKSALPEPKINGNRIVVNGIEIEID